MRNLTLSEIGFVSGAGDVEPGQCKDSGDSSIGNQSTFKEDAIAAYEGAIATVVYIAERITSAVKSI